MDTTTIATPGSSTASLVLVGLLISTFVLAALISVLYWLNTRIRRSMKKTHDDWNVEQDIESGHTLHAEGIYGSRHPDEGGMHLKQEDPHPPLANLKPGLRKHRLRKDAGVETYENQEQRNVY
ncbi:MAG: hypothetical protein JST04_13500 [Bdellovibrionales bacterium]|nr:hypothetical protein [Bdellovibrionales bacterium]